MYPIKGSIDEGAEQGLVTGARGLMRDARDRAPEDDGDLKRSARVVNAYPEVYVKFTAPHAWLLHERTEWQHPNGGEAKFLENAMVEYPLAEAVAVGIRAVLRG